MVVGNTCLMANETDSFASIVKGHIFQEPIWNTSFVASLIYCILTGIIILVGTVGNITILLVLPMKRSINTIGRIFMINLAVADLCIAAIAEPMCLVGAILGEAWFSENWFVCEAVSVLCFTACICSYMSLILQAFNRYLYICQIKLYYIIYKTRRCVIACIACWIFALVFDSANIWGWGDHNFDRKNNKCSWSRSESFSYTMFITVSLLGPFVPLVVSFVLIFRKIARCKTNVYKLTSDHPLRNRKARSESLRSSRTLLVSFIMFIVCWTPFSLINVLDFADTARPEIYMFITLLAHVHSCCNFCIYMTCNRTFRNYLSTRFLNRNVSATRSLSKNGAVQASLEKRVRQSAI